MVRDSLLRWCGRQRVVGLIVVLLTAITSSPAEAQASPDAPRAPGRLIDLGGWHMHLNCTGNRPAGSPLVVLEAGAGDGSSEWVFVQTGVAAFARVCSYDRSGTAWSDLGPYPHTGRQIGFELAALLQRAGEAPPYLLVGHSAGGRYVRIFTTMFPALVAGIVFVDAGHEDGTLTINGKPQRLRDTATGQPVPEPKLAPPLALDELPEIALRQIQAAIKRMPDPAASAPYDKLPASARDARRWTWSQPKHLAANNSPFDGDEALAMRRERENNPRPLGDRPIVVITRGTPIIGPMSDQLEAERKQLQAQLTQLSSRGRQIIAANSGHHIHIDEPHVVVSAIRELLREASTRPSSAP